MEIFHTIIALLIFGFLVFIHELGHFIVAKKNHVRVYEFAIGMGPSLFKKTYHDTVYSINCIPMCGFVRMSPFEGDGEVPCLPEEDFNNKKPKQKIAVALAGPVMNIIFAILSFCLFVGIVGYEENIVNQVLPNYPAYQAGISEGDSIVAVNGVTTNRWEDVTKEISKVEKDTIIVIDIVTDKQEKKTVDIVPVLKDGRYMIGITPKIEHRFLPSVKRGFSMTLLIGTDMLLFLKQLITGRANTNDLSGPIGIIQAVSHTAKVGSEYLLYITGIISLNLGILNLLPIPALDGSRILISIIELLRKGKKLSLKWENRINIVGFAFLLGLMALVTYKDIVRIFF